MCLVVQAQERTDKWGVPYVKLNNGVEMPRFGLGTYAVSNDDCRQACLVALKEGYRHIDTAHAYNNEKEWAQPSRKAVSLVKKYG